MSPLLARSRYCTSIHLKKHSDSEHHRPETNWHSRYASVSHLVCFVHPRLVWLTWRAKASHPLRALPTVRSWTCGFLGRRLRISPFISIGISRQFSLVILHKHSFISLSTRTLFRPPSGLSAILTSLRFRANSSCSWPVHSWCVSHQKVIFLWIFERPNNPLTVL